MILAGRSVAITLRPPPTRDSFSPSKQPQKSFGSVPVLRGVELALFSGEIHGLMGENGAGKSTLIKILSGEPGGRLHHLHDEWRIYVIGRG